MSTYETLRAKPRIIVIGRDTSQHIDFAEYVDVEPYEEESLLSVSRSETGRAQVLHGNIAGALRIRLGVPSLDLVNELKQLFRVYSARGVPFEFIMDRLRGMRIVGDTERDEASWFGPFNDGSILYSFEMAGALPGCTGIATFPATLSQYERTECIKNGDLVDGNELALPTSWTNETTGTLRAFKLQHSPPVLNAARTAPASVLVVQATAAGAKTLAVAFDLGQFNGSDIAYDATPNTTLGLTFAAKIDMQPDAIAALNAGGNEVMAVALRATSSSAATRDDPTDIALTTEWQRFFIRIQPTDTQIDRTGHVLFDFTDLLAGHSISIHDVRMTQRRGWSGPAPYSASRSDATGVRGQGHLIWLNRLGYGHQVPTWQNGERFGFAWSAWYTPWWSSTGGGDEIGPEFTVIAATNNWLDFADNGVEKNVFVPQGQYDAAELARAITTAMNAAPGITNTYLCSYNVGTDKFTIARASGSNSFSLLWDSGANTTITIGEVLGYDTSADDTGLTTYVADDADSGFLTLAQTCDTTVWGNESLLWVYVSKGGVKAKVQYSDGTSELLTYAMSFTAGVPVHILVTGRDWDGSTGGSGAVALWVGGVSRDTATSSLWLASAGKFVTVGSHVTRLNACAGALNDWRFDPTYMDSSAYVIGDYYAASPAMPERMRNVWRCVPDGKGMSYAQFNDRDNAYEVDIRALEDNPFAW